MILDQTKKNQSSNMRTNAIENPECVTFIDVPQRMNAHVLDWVLLDVVLRTRRHVVATLTCPKKVPIRCDPTFWY